MKISVGTYNILSGVDYMHRVETKEWRLVPERFAEAIKEMGLDICALNEVRDIPGDDEHKWNQTGKAIAEQLGYNYVFGKAIDIPGGGYGNALVTRYPILNVRTVPMRIAPENRDPNSVARWYEDRVLMIVDLDVEGKTVTVMVTHFGLNDDEHVLAVKIVRQEAEKINNPIIFMGDLNITEDTRHYAALCEFLTDSIAVAQGEVKSFPADAPDRRIDFLFTKGEIKALESRVPSIVVSDHRPFVATVEL